MIVVRGDFRCSKGLVNLPYSLLGDTLHYIKTKKVNYNYNTLSDRYLIKTGVPQGNVLDIILLKDNGPVTTSKKQTKLYKYS